MTRIINSAVRFLLCLNTLQSDFSIVLMMVFFDGKYSRSKWIAFCELSYVTLFYRRLFGKLGRAQIADMVYTDGKE